MLERGRLKFVELVSGAQGQGCLEPSQIRARVRYTQLGRDTLCLNSTYLPSDT